MPSNGTRRKSCMEDTVLSQFRTKQREDSIDWYNYHRILRNKLAKTKWSDKKTISFHSLFQEETVVLVDLYPRRAKCFCSENSIVSTRDESNFKQQPLSSGSTYRKKLFSPYIYKKKTTASSTHNQISEQIILNRDNHTIPCQN